jgi:hypothetical protein
MIVIDAQEVLLLSKYGLNSVTKIGFFHISTGRAVKRAATHVSIQATINSDDGFFMSRAAAASRADRLVERYRALARPPLEPASRATHKV